MDKSSKRENFCKSKNFNPKEDVKKSCAILEDKIVELEHDLAQLRKNVKNKESIIKMQSDQLRKMEEMQKRTLDDNKSLINAKRKAQNDLDNLKIIIKEHEAKQKETRTVSCGPEDGLIDRSEHVNMELIEATLKQQQLTLAAIFAICVYLAHTQGSNNIDQIKQEIAKAKENNEHEHKKFENSSQSSELEDYVSSKSDISNKSCLDDTEVYETDSKEINDDNQTRDLNTQTGINQNIINTNKVNQESKIIQTCKVEIFPESSIECDDYTCGNVSNTFSELKPLPLHNDNLIKVDFEDDHKVEVKGQNSTNKKPSCLLQNSNTKKYFNDDNGFNIESSLDEFICQDVYENESKNLDYRERKNCQNFNDNVMYNSENESKSVEQSPPNINQTRWNTDIEYDQNTNLKEMKKSKKKRSSHVISQKKSNKVLHSEHGGKYTSNNTTNEIEQPSQNISQNKLKYEETNAESLPQEFKNSKDKTKSKNRRLFKKRNQSTSVHNFKSSEEISVKNQYQDVINNLIDEVESKTLQKLEENFDGNELRNSSFVQCSITKSSEIVEDAACNKNVMKFHESEENTKQFYSKDIDHCSFYDKRISHDISSPDPKESCFSNMKNNTCKEYIESNEINHRIYKLTTPRICKNCNGIQNWELRDEEIINETCIINNTEDVRDKISKSYIDLEHLSLLEEENCILRQSIEKLRKSCQVSESKLNSAEITCSKFKSEVDFKTKENERLQKELVQLKAQLSKLIENLEKEMHEAKKYYVTEEDEHEEELKSKYTHQTLALYEINTYENPMCDPFNQKQKFNLDPHNIDIQKLLQSNTNINFEDKKLMFKNIFEIQNTFYSKLKLENLALKQRVIELEQPSFVEDISYKNIFNKENCQFNNDQNIFENSENGSDQQNLNNISYKELYLQNIKLKQELKGSRIFLNNLSYEIYQTSCNYTNKLVDPQKDFDVMLTFSKIKSILEYQTDYITQQNQRFNDELMLIKEICFKCFTDIINSMRVENDISCESQDIKGWLVQAFLKLKKAIKTFKKRNVQYNRQLQSQMQINKNPDSSTIKFEDNIKENEQKSKRIIKLQAKIKKFKMNNEYNLEIISDLENRIETYKYNCDEHVMMLNFFRKQNEYNLVTINELKQQVEYYKIICNQCNICRNKHIQLKVIDQRNTELKSIYEACNEKLENQQIITEILQKHTFGGFKEIGDFGNKHVQRSSSDVCIQYKNHQKITEDLQLQLVKVRKGPNYFGNKHHTPKSLPNICTQYYDNSFQEHEIKFKNQQEITENLQFQLDQRSIELIKYKMVEILNQQSIIQDLKMLLSKPSTQLYDSKNKLLRNENIELVDVGIQVSEKLFANMSSNSDLETSNICDVFSKNSLDDNIVNKYYELEEKYNWQKCELNKQNINTKVYELKIEDFKQKIYENKKLIISLQKENHRLKNVQADFTKFKVKLTMLKQDFSKISIEKEELQRVYKDYKNARKTLFKQVIQLVTNACEKYKANFDRFNARISKYIQEQSEYEKEVEDEKRKLLQENAKLTRRLNDQILIPRFISEQDLTNDVSLLNASIECREREIESLMEENKEARSLLQKLMHDDSMKASCEDAVYFVDSYQHNSE